MEKFLATYMPVDASAHGPQLDHISVLVHWLMLLLFIGWGSYFVYALLRFRAKKNPSASYHGATSHFSTYTEVGVAVLELVLLIGFSVPAWYRWSKPLPDETNALRVRVVAEQFAWNIHYPGPDGVFGRTNINLVSGSNPIGLDLSDPKAKDDITTINQLHLEVNRPTLIRLTSKDVIHSFSLPVMRVKQDAIPGEEIPIHFTPVKTNDGRDWQIACAQLCGLAHYRMRGYLTVHSKGDFEKWLKDNAPVQEAAAASAGQTPASQAVTPTTPGSPAAAGSTPVSVEHAQGTP